MNQYEVEFFTKCPDNNVRVKYALKVRTPCVLEVDHILTIVTSYVSYRHEALADELHRHFGGTQILTAFHHGVTITTERR